MTTPLERRVRKLEARRRPTNSDRSHLVLLRPGDDEHVEQQRQAPEFRAGDELLVVRFVRAGDKNQAVH